MSDYRRLISYIYAYEGGEKGKNIGFAKIDMRGLQCRIQVNVKKVYVAAVMWGCICFIPAANFCLAGSLSAAVRGNTALRCRQRM